MLDAGRRLGDRLAVESRQGGSKQVDEISWRAAEVGNLRQLDPGRGTAADGVEDIVAGGHDRVSFCSSRPRVRAYHW